MIDLHMHSTYSYLDAFGLAPQLLERAEQLGRKAIALTDHDGVWGIPFLEKNNKNGMKLLYGAEMRMIEKIVDLKEVKKNHITMIAKNQNGWAKLCNLITRAYDEDHFYYYPTLDIKMMTEGAGDLIILSGCMSSLVSKYLLENELDKATEVAKQFKNAFGRDYYLELIPIENFPDSVSVLAAGLRKISKTLDIPIVITHDVHQLERGQTDIWKMLHCIRQRRTMEEIEQQTFATDCYQMEDDEAYRSALKVLGDVYSKDEIMQMFHNQERVVSDCDSYKLKKGKIVQFKNAREILERKAWEGLASRGLSGKQIYEDRLKYELDLITQKDFCDYFLIVSDLTNWAKRSGYLVGSGRGSAAGGLICYVLRITEIDPVFHDVMFERFISVDRMDPPDIDIDFQSSARQDVLHYLYTKYGRDRAAQIGAFSTFGGKNTLDEVGKMYRVPKFEVESLKDKLVTRIGVELRASFTIMDTIEGFRDAKAIAERYPVLLNAVKLEGQIRHFGAQAAGAVVNSFPLNYITPLMEREEKHMVFFDGEISKYLNILKIDTLGINALDKINTALDAIGKDYDWLSKSSYEDDKTFKLFNDVDVKGIFQYEKNTGPSLLRQIHIDNFEDLVALNALARPGPLHSGATQIYTRAKEENNPQAWNNPIMDKITERTHGVIIYQEQTMACCRLLGHMEWEDISHVRTIMSKSMGKEYFEKYREKFVGGSTTKGGVTEEFANHVFDHICFSRGTKIQCQEGSTIVEKNIEDVQIGDLVASMDRDFSIVFNPVSRLYENAAIHLMDIVFDNGVRIKCTPSHPFYVARGLLSSISNTWIKAMDLSMGDECAYSQNGEIDFVTIKQINFSTLKDWQKVYNLEVEFTHNYFANGICGSNCTHGQWSFNRGHSVSYTDISYKMAYIKAHYPRHFYYSLLMNEDVEDKVNGYLRDYIEKGYGRILPPKLNHSDTRWKLEGNDLRAGLTQVKGLGEKAAEHLISLYPIKDMEDLKKRATKRICNIRIIRLIEEYKMLTDEEEVDVFGLYDFAERMKNVERTHRIGDITYQFKARPVILAGVLSRQVNQKNLSELEVSVKLKDYSRYNKAHGDEFAIFYIKDETQTEFQCIIDNKLYPQYKDLLWSKKVGSDIIRVKGVIPPSKMFMNVQDIEGYNDQKYSGCACYKCPMIKNSFVPPYGSKTSSILILGEAPGATEVEKGQPFVGRAGSVLGDILAELGLDRSHLYLSNSCFCRPTDGNKNRTPVDEEIACCRGHLEWEIEEIKPKVIVAMGKVATASILNKKIEEIKIGKLVETVMDLETLSSKYKGVLLIPSYHPAAVLYGDANSGYRDSIKNSLKLALEESNKQIKRKAKKEII